MIEFVYSEGVKFAFNLGKFYGTTNLLLFNNPNTFSASQIFDTELSPPEICLRRAWHRPSTPGVEFFNSSPDSQSTYKHSQQLQFY